MNIISTDNPELNIDLSMVVRAIEKAVSEDIPRQLSEHPMETNNYIGLMRGDWINQNLRAFAPIDDYELLRIQRYGWKGRIIINRDKRITLSVCTEANLRTIPLKQRSRPHYAMSLLKVQNGDLQGMYQQQWLYPIEPFEDQVLEEDYDDIIGGAIDPAEGYRHYFVTYKASGDELTDVKLVLMDPYFNVVSEQSLNHLIKPDFSRLTNSILSIDESTPQTHREATRGLSKLKPGLRKMEEQA